MIIGILSDIHGNAFALQKVLEEAKKSNVEKLLLLGDYVGYYYDAAEVFALLKSWDGYFIKGNHEEILVSYLASDEQYRHSIKAKYGAGYEACKALDETTLSFIKSLPEKLSIKIDGLNILLTHGSPGSINEYLYPDTHADKLNSFDVKEYDFVFSGHTHYPMFKIVGNTAFINPGSVGQSRVVGGIANWGILNTSNKVYRPMAAKYNTEKLIIQTKEFDPALPYLHEVLVRNN